MSYQYPIPSGPNADIPSSLINEYHLPAPPALPQALHHSTMAPIKGDGSLTSKLGKMKRSISTPNVQGQARADTKETALSAEKRRNKLGYHRTSVACGHCRRRKIRCIPAQGDPQNRCSNCIRLKKPCNFFPVDQQPQADAGHRRDSQVQGAVGPSSSASSPTESVGPAEIQNNLPFSHLSMPSIHDIGGAQLKKTRTDSFSSEKKDLAFSYPHDFGPLSAGWMPADPVILSKGSSDMSSSYWRMSSHESPLTPAFSPFTPNLQLPHHPTWSPAAAEPSPREEFGWPAPQRSMSYSNHETLSHSNYTFHPPPQPTNVRDDFTNRSSPHQLEIYPPTLPPATSSLSAADATTIATSTSSTPQSSGALPPFSSAQSWQSYSYKVSPVPSSTDGFPGWYGSASSLSSQSQSVGGEGIPPVTTYGHTEPYGMYYQNANQGR